MIALEGQIYETDIGNPELSKLGKLDFAFVAAFLLPVLLVLVLFDLRAVEIRNNRWAFVSVTAGNGNNLLLLRATVRSLILAAGMVVPFIVTIVLGGIEVFSSFEILIAVILNTCFWLVLSFIVFTRTESGPTTAAILMACWFAVAVIIPVGGKYMVETLIPSPNGGELLLTQRETVNDAWDLPKESTMKPFIERHAKWSNTPKIEKPFEWKWYYAFQQVGDQTVEDTSVALSEAVKKRDDAMGFISILSPSLFTQRTLSRIANTNIDAFQKYESCVRSFHQSLREFHYPMLFGDVPFSEETMAELPMFKPCS